MKMIYRFKSMTYDIKHCNSCSTEKPVSEFHKRAASFDGLSPRCKACQKAYDKSRLHEPGRVDARQQYAKSDHGRARQTAAKKAWIGRNPEKRKAHHAVNNAIRDGRLKREPCKCGNPDSHGHHDDYSKPLDVIWLCVQCHHQLHKEQG